MLSSFPETVDLSERLAINAVLVLVAAFVVVHLTIPRVQCSPPGLRESSWRAEKLGD